MRIALLWKRMSSYMAACIRALQGLGVEVWVAALPAHVDAPYSDSEWGFPVSMIDPGVGRDWLRTRLVEFNPHVVLVSSWDVAPYRKLAAENPTRALRVLCMHNQWLGTPKQWLGRAASRWYVRSAFDVAWVPADRAFGFARRLGFSSDRIWWGHNTADVDAFSPISSRLHDTDVSLPRAFLFVGRLVKEKGIDDLVDAYESYRSRSADPWLLFVAGTGPSQSLLSNVEGVQHVGFVQPGELPRLMSRASCLVLPSRFEPWGVVIHEACAAGLSVIASRSCGATSRLVLPGFNGSIIERDDPPALANALDWYAGLTDGDRRRMGETSYLLSKQFSPGAWAETVVRGALAHREG